jgi:hypothetical protein
MSALGPIASVELRPRHVGFTPDCGHVTAPQRNDATGHLRKFYKRLQREIGPGQTLQGADSLISSRPSYLTRLQVAPATSPVLAGNVPGSNLSAAPTLAAYCVHAVRMTEKSFCASVLAFGSEVPARDAR